MKKNRRDNGRLTLSLETLAQLDASQVSGGDTVVEPIDPNNSALCSSPGHGGKCLVSYLMPCQTHG